jgi:hypothetical protein
VNLSNINISYLILSTSNNDVAAILDSKSYQILPLQSYRGGKYDSSYMGYSDVDNNTLRSDVIFLLEKTNINHAIIKYKGESLPRKIFYDGRECLLDINMYDSEHTDTTYLYKGLSFSFKEAKRYWIPKRKEDFRVGMIVEYFNNNKWNEKLVENPDVEWDKMFKLLLKYNKIRVPSRL